MSDKRRLSIAVTLFITADLTTEGDNTNVGLVDVSHNIMGGVSPIGQDVVPETTQMWKEAVTNSATKLGLKHLLDEMKGEHTVPPPATNQPGADA